MLFSPAELDGERKVNWKVKKEPCLLSQRISWEQNKDGKNVLENKAVSRSRGLSSDIALWLLISAWKAQPSWLENTHCSPLLLALLTANPLKSIYGLIDITYLTAARLFSQEVACNLQRTCIWHMQHITVILKLKFKAVHCWNKTHKGCRLLFWSDVWKVTQHNKWHHTVTCASSLISIELRAPCWRSKSSPATHLSSLVTAVILLVRSGLLSKPVFCTSDGAVVETKASGGLQNVSWNINDVGHFIY